MKSLKSILLVTIPLCAVAAALLIATPAFSYLPQYAATNAPDHWPTGSAVVWDLNTCLSNCGTGKDATILGGGSVPTIVADSFHTWATAPNTSLTVSQRSTTSKVSQGNDGTNLICFVCQGDFSKDSSTLAVTFDTVISGSPGAGQFTGQIIDADTLFNTAVTWLTNGATCPTNANCADLQTVATHEFGHFLGLDHTGVVRAVMYPFAADQMRTLGYDDVVGISLLYPSNTPSVATGSISGTIRNASGAGVCGAHVFADSITSNTGYPSPIRKTPVSSLTNSSGDYTIKGLPPDSYTVSVEPLNGPVSNSDISGYAPIFCGGGSVSTNFTTRQY